MFEREGAARRIRRAAVVDEFVLQRSRVAQLLTHELELDVVEASTSLREFMSWLRHAERTQWPHLLVLGISKQEEAAQHAAAIAALRRAGIRVLALTSVVTRTTARRLFAEGIEGLVSSSDSEEAFLTVVDTVLNGLSAMTPRGDADVRGSAPAPHLSLQEARVFTLYTSGLTITEVASRIGVRPDTARKYLRRVRDKFVADGRPARTKLELARIAWAEGYVEHEISLSSRDSEPRTAETSG